MWIDSHAHLHDTAFKSDRREALSRAREAGVEAIVEVGTDLSTSRRAIALAHEFDCVYAAVGIHPHEADRVSDEALRELGALARSPKVVAIGETGLDFYRNRSSRAGQERALRAEIAIARDLGLPLILHLRSGSAAPPGDTGATPPSDAYEACLAILREQGGVIGGVSHCFAGSTLQVRSFTDLGFFISFAGNVTYRGAFALREAARAVPADRILVETDCPYLAPEGRRGKRNEPAFVASTGQALAGFLGRPVADFAATTSANARRLFRIP